MLHMTYHGHEMSRAVSDSAKLEDYKASRAGRGYIQSCLEISRVLYDGPRSQGPPFTFSAADYRVQGFLRQITCQSAER